MTAKAVLKKITYILTLLLCLYLFFGYVFAPRILKAFTIKQTKTTTGLNIAFNNIHFNPLRFSVELSDIEVSDAKGKGFLSAQYFKANFNPMQLLFGQFHFSHVSLIDPKFNAILDSDLNLTQPQFSFTPNDKSEASSINLLIDQIRIEHGQANINSTAFAQGIQVNDLDFSLNQFNLFDIDSKFKLNISTPQNEKITLNGNYNHSLQSLSSDFTLGNIQSQTISSFLPPDLAITLTDGNINSEGKLTWSLVSLPEFNLGWLEWSELSGRWSENGEINQTFVGGEGINIDLKNQQIQVKNINAKQGEIYITWPWLQNETTSPPASPSIPWHYDIEQITLSEISAKLTDKNLTAETSQTIRSARILNLSSQTSPSDFSFLLDNESNGTFKANGRINMLDEFKVQAEIDIKNLKLEPFNPWFEDLTQFQLIKGTLSAQQQFTFQYQNWQSTGSIVLSGFQVIDTTKQDLINFGILDVAQSLITSKGKHILLNQITLDQANGFIPSTIQKTDQKSAHNQDSIEWRVTLGEIRPPE